jgi:hypothetical protein
MIIDIVLIAAMIVVIIFIARDYLHFKVEFLILKNFQCFFSLLLFFNKSFCYILFSDVHYRMELSLLFELLFNRKLAFIILGKALKTKIENEAACADCPLE